MYKQAIKKCTDLFALKNQTVKLLYVAPPLSMQHLMSKNKDWMAQDQNNVSEWIDMSTHGLHVVSVR